MPVWGIREFNTHLPHCLTECGCRTLVQETEGSVTGGEKNKKTHLDMAERKVSTGLNATKWRLNFSFNI